MFRIRFPKKTLRFIVVITVPVIVILASYLRLFEVFELATLDFRFKARPCQKTTDDIAIIEIAQDTLDKIGQWPIDRKFHAALIEALSYSQARSVIFDILFSMKSNDSSDELLNESVAKAGNVYLPMALQLSDVKRKAGFYQGVKIEAEPLEKLKTHAKGIGHINAATDIDGKKRRAPVFIDYKGNKIAHISLLAVCDMLGIDMKNTKMKGRNTLLLDENTAIPMDSKGNMMINYAGYWGQAFRHYSFIDILTSLRDAYEGRQGVIDLKELKGKVCIVGLTAAATHDLNPIPLQERYPMVGLHANFINTVVLKNFITRPGPFANIVILIIISGLMALAVLRLRPALGLAAAVIIFSGYAILAFLLFAWFNIWIDLFYPLILIFGVYILCTFYQYIAEQNKRFLMQRDLDIAKRIQQSFLKPSAPEKKGLDIGFKMEPAKSIGGDLYDFVLNSDKSLGIMVGDVSGKGVPAALFMAMTVSSFRFHSKTECDPVKVVSHLNDQIACESTSGLFVTLTYLCIEAEYNRLSICDAGHLPIVYAGKDKETTLITAKSGMALGIMEEVEFTKTKISVSPGDVLVLYTDGVTEARNPRAEEFGEKRLVDMVSEARHLSAKEITESIYDGIIKFRKKAPQHDDITIMVIKIN